MKNKIIIVKKFGTQYRKEDELTYKNEEKITSYKKHALIIPPKNTYTFSTNKLNILFYDLDNAEYITFEKHDLGLSTSFLDKLLNQAIIGQLVSAVKKASDESKTDFDFIKEGIKLGACLLLGYLLGVSL